MYDLAVKRIDSLTFNPIQDGHFRGCSRWEGGGGGLKAQTAKNLLHISHNDETWHSYTLPKENPKNK